jgi:hypothetical protein
VNLSPRDRHAYHSGHWIQRAVRRLFDNPERPELKLELCPHCGFWHSQREGHGPSTVEPR